MKIAILFCLISLTTYAKWNFKSDYGQTKIYISTDETRLTLNYSETEKKKKQFSKKFVDGLKEDKIKMLGLMGVTNWTVTRSEVFKDTKSTRVELEGSYVNSSGEKVFFKEFHFYSDIKKLQILLTNSSIEKLNQDGKLENIANFRATHDL
ncbi:hypothetical protein [Bacteriovorax sp. Seq25_V]|uniref:hypothetical protein n=1 Tax=Bacteriovorax sp. Seq25_V TaxID=1201288 RepID=UPI00038A4776|nr:hypothetical protein [Bacteriovorax sp. Seq25_V]EQC47227.1 hypothetical protein M900_0841 [Bacteriovorax sp. Seq25_V]